MKSIVTKILLAVGMTASWTCGFPGAQASLLPTVFDNRQDVNLMNADDVAITPLQQSLIAGVDASNLRASWMDTTFWDGGPNPGGGTNSLTINFGEARNLKTIRLFQYPGSEMTSGVVETSTDGVNWAVGSFSSSVSGQQTELVLNNAVNAQYLRLTATAINDVNGVNRWIVNSLRVFGDTGTIFDSSNHLDLVSSTGLKGGVSLTLNGSVSITDVTPSQFVNDALNPIQRQVLYNLGTGDGFTLAFGQPFVFTKLGLFHSFNAIADRSVTNASFTVQSSLDGLNWITVLNQAGFPLDSIDSFNLAPADGKYLRFTFTNDPSADDRISDIQVFGYIPEPATVGLLSLGGIFLLFRRRR